MFDMHILLTGLIIFLSRICDVSIGTVRTIVTVQGRTAVAFILALFEVSIWIVVVSTVIQQVNEQPLLIVFYAFGYATGNVVGILVERKLAFGITVVKVITRTAGGEIAEYLRRQGQPVTAFTGEGMMGPVCELYIASRRRDLKWILDAVKKLDSEAFYIIESAMDISSTLKDAGLPLRGIAGIWKMPWRLGLFKAPIFSRRLAPTPHHNLRL